MFYANMHYIDTYVQEMVRLERLSRHTASKKREVTPVKEGKVCQADRGENKRERTEQKQKLQQKQKFRRRETLNEFENDINYNQNKTSCRYDD